MVEGTVSRDCLMCGVQPKDKGTINVPDAGVILGICRNVAYELANRGEFPIRVIRLGRRKVVSRAELHQLIHPH